MALLGWVDFGIVCLFGVEMLLKAGSAYSIRSWWTKVRFVALTFTRETLWCLVLFSSERELGLESSRDGHLH
jgi:hypothetical protein